MSEPRTLYEPTTRPMKADIYGADLLGESVMLVKAVPCKHKNYAPHPLEYITTGIAPRSYVAECDGKPEADNE